MMDCKKVEKHLVEYLYQELSPEKTLQVEKHLETCDACAKTLHNWRGIHRGFQRSNDVPQPAPFLKTRILAAAKQELGRKTPLMERIVVWLKPAVIMPILIFAVLVVWFLPMSHKEVAQVPHSVPVEASRKAADQRYAATPSAPAPELKGQLSKEDSEQLRSLGYVSGSKSNDETITGETPVSRLSEPEVRMKSKAATSDQIAGGRTEDYSRERDQEKPAAQYKEEQSQIDQPSAPTISYEKQSVLADKKAASGTPAPAAVQELSKSAPGKDAAADDFAVAQNYFVNGDLSNGTKMAQYVIRNDKNQSRAVDFDNAGRNYQAQGACEQAIIQYNMVLNNYRKYEQSPDVLQRLGECYEQIGQYEQASNTYRQLQQVPAKKDLATQKLRTLTKKRQVQEQLRSLGYVDQKENE